MDNGLIFPYRYKTAHGDLVILTARIVLERVPSGIRRVRGAQDLNRGAKRINRCDAGR